MPVLPWKETKKREVKDPRGKEEQTSHTPGGNFEKEGHSVANCNEQKRGKKGPNFPTSLLGEGGN